MAEQEAGTSRSSEKWISEEHEERDLLKDVTPQGDNTSVDESDAVEEEINEVDESNAVESEHFASESVFYQADGNVSEKNNSNENDPESKEPVPEVVGENAECSPGYQNTQGASRDSETKFHKSRRQRKQLTPKKCMSDTDVLGPSKMKDLEICNSDTNAIEDPVGDSTHVEPSSGKSRNKRKSNDLKETAKKAKYSPKKKKEASTPRSKKKAPVKRQPLRRKTSSSRTPKSKVDTDTSFVDTDTSFIEGENDIAMKSLGNARITAEGGNMVDKPQPAVSLKIICTPFGQGKAGANNATMESPGLTMQNEIESEVPLGIKSTNKKQPVQRNRPKAMVKQGKKGKSPKKKTVPPECHTDKSNVKPNDSKKLTSPKKGVSETNDSVAPEVKLEKRTRAMRKRKETVDFVIDFMNESEDDIDLDFSEDEYVPSKDELSEKKVKEKVLPEFNSESEDEDKENEKRKSKSFKVSVKTPKRRRKHLIDEDKSSGTPKSNRKANVKPKTPRKVKSPKTKRTGSSSQENESAGVSSVSPKSKAKPRKRSRKKKGEDNANDCMDMPFLVSPKKKMKSKKRKIRLLPRQTYLDSALDYSTAEDFGMTSVTEDEQEGNKVRKRRRRRRYGEPYSVTGSWYIAQGYLSDITELLDKFSYIDGWRFKDFAKCWQEMKFSLVYRGRQNFKELLEFSEEVAFLTKRFMMHPHSNKYRIGALYAMYGLYYKHPFRHFFKIRLTKEEYQQLLELTQPYRTNLENTDPAYIFRKLEVDGAIFHVAASLELCIDFYNAERESVDVKYESQKLAKSSVVVSTLPPEVLGADDQLLKHYHSIKANISGDGNEPEKALSYVMPSAAEGIQKRVDELKDATLNILRLDDPPTSKVSSPPEDNTVPDIGTRRAEIISRAGKSDLGKEFLKKRCFQEETAFSKASKNKKFTGIVGARQPRQGLSKENELTMSQYEVQDFMKAPSEVTLNQPVKPRRSPRKIAHKFIKKPMEETDEAESEPSISVKPEIVQSLKETSISEEDDDVPNERNSENDLNVFNQVPAVDPKPKKFRSKPRKRILSQALEKENSSFVLRDIQVLKRKVSDDLLRKRRMKSKLKGKSWQTESPNSETHDSSIVFVADSHDVSVMEVPSEEISTRELAAEEISTRVQESVCVAENSQGASSQRNTSNQRFVENKDFITLNIHFRGENVDEMLPFNISSTHWNDIQGDERKLERLKLKLISTILPDNIRQSIAMGKKVDVDISSSDAKASSILHNDSVGHDSSDIHNSSALQSKQSSLAFPKTERCDYYSEEDAQMPDYSDEDDTQDLTMHDTSSNNVIKELQQIWSPNCEIKPLVGQPFGRGPGMNSVNRIENGPLPNASGIVNGNTVGFLDGEDYENFVTDCEDFEDESGPIILTSQMSSDDKDGEDFGDETDPIMLTPKKSSENEVREGFVDESAPVFLNSEKLNENSYDNTDEDFGDETDPIILTPEKSSENKVGKSFVDESAPIFLNSEKPSENSDNNTDGENFGDECDPIILTNDLTPEYFGEQKVTLNTCVPSLQKSVPEIHRVQVPVPTSTAHRPLQDSNDTYFPFVPAVPLSKVNSHESVSVLQGIMTSALLNKPSRNASPIVQSDQHQLPQSDISNKAMLRIKPEVIKEHESNLSFGSQGFLPKPREELREPENSDSLVKPQFTKSISVTIASPKDLTPYIISSIPPQGFRPIPSTVTQKFIKVKVNDKIVLMPAENVLPRSSQVSNTSKINKNSSFVSPQNITKDSKRQVGIGNLTNNKNLIEPSGMKSSYSSNEMENLPSSSGVVRPAELNETFRTDLSSSSLVSDSSRPSSVCSNTSSNRVCSFVFSPKYKALSKIMKDTTIGQATGTPLSSKKPAIPFLLKSSLRPKRKSL